MISQVRIEDHLNQYKKTGIPTAFAGKLQHIVNGIPLPKVNRQKDFSGSIKVLYVGRGTEEKRVQLIAEIAEKAALQKLAAEFVFMGDVEEAIPHDQKKYCKLLGHKSDPDQIDEIYQQSHIIIITSYTEGFPIAIEEGMARGCAVIATPVGDIPIHVKPHKNGFLFSSVTDETLIINEGVDFISLLCMNKNLLKEMGGRNSVYAAQNFSIEAFNESYQQLFKKLRSE